MHAKFSSIFLVRCITASLFTSVIAGTWDAWWHGAIGRESLFEPPHLLLYISTLIGVALGMYGWYQTKEKIWKRVAVCLMLIPLSAPFDELWHRLFGVEDLSSPLIVWSPPHLAIIFALTASFISLLPLIKQDTDLLARRLFGSISLAGVLSLLFFVLAPLQPTGPWKLLGFWGAGILAALLVSMLISSEKLFPGIGSGISVMVFYLVISAISFGEVINPNIKIAPHEHPPSYVVIFSFMLAGLLFDLSKKLPYWFRGGLVGLVWSIILYGLSSYYFSSAFKYGLSEMVVAVVASVIGGVVLGLITQFFKRSKSL